MDYSNYSNPDKELDDVKAQLEEYVDKNNELRAEANHLRKVESDLRAENERLKARWDSMLPIIVDGVRQEIDSLIGKGFV